MHLDPNDETLKFFHKILKAAVDADASDIHAKAGHAVIFRLHRRLVEIECPHPSQEWFEDLADKIIPKHAKEQFARERGADFSYFTPDAGRFRTNLFLQRGEYALCMRYVKSEVPSLDKLGLNPFILKRPVASSCWPAAPAAASPRRWRR
jgi:Tfp pilus assembly pilus retraction ATPase PilT